jgi:nucleoside-diphosphate-sugar epimerase
MGEVYNITNGDPIRFWDFVEMVLRQANLTTDRKKLPYWPIMTAAVVNELICELVRKKTEPTLLPISIGTISFSMTMNIEKARLRLGYKPTLSTEDGIHEFINSWHSNKTD